LVASIPINDGDVLEWTMEGLEIAAEPTCSLVEGSNCPASVACSQSKGKIRATFGITEGSSIECTAENADFKFLVEGVKNAPTMVPSSKVIAQISTKSYQLVGAYSGTLQITNTAPGYLLRKNIVIE
jgi:hypothetical protein